MKDLVERIRFYLKIAGVTAIYRRYFVMNAFDGALTALGVVLGAWASGAIQPRIIVGAGVGVSLAMGMSGFSGAYLAERAERLRRLRELERSLLRSLERSVHGRALRTAIIWAAAVDALSPALSSLTSISPFIAAEHGVVSVSEAAAASVIIIFAILFILGVFTGRVSREHAFISGLRMLIVGVLTAALILLWTGYRG
ncbi:MAG: VIT1/CCC1 transporter family protein [Candidatus Bathyarchaeia archaeon]|nr:VIT1/CCC1 transporter family protein [Candidatus Bathyarchaeota archaeon]